MPCFPHKQRVFSPSPVLSRLIPSFSNTLSPYKDNSNYLLALYKDKVKGLVGEKDYFTMANDFSKERERTEYQIKEADRHLEELEAQMLAGDQRKEIIQRYTHVEHLTREMVEILIDYITVGKRVPGTQDVPIEIYWNF